MHRAPGTDREPIRFSRADSELDTFGVRAGRSAAPSGRWSLVVPPRPHVAVEASGYMGPHDPANADMLVAMPSTAVVAVILVGLVVVVAYFVLRSRAKAAEPEAPRFEPPREIVKRPAKEETETPPPAAEAKKAEEPPPPSSASEPGKAAAPENIPTPPAAPTSEVQAEAKPAPANDKPSVDAVPASTEEVVADQILESASVEKLKTPAAPMPPPPLPLRESKPGAPRPPMRSYSNISDESVAEELKRESAVPAEPKPTSEPKVAAKPISEPKVPPAKPKLPVSEPKTAAAKPLPTSQPKVPAAKSEPKLAAKSEPNVSTSKPLPASQSRITPTTKADEHDFSALDEPPAPKPTPAATAAATAAKFVPPPNPATADLEKNDPRHAAARRLARVSVSEIKLYHEDEVKAGREAKDLWKRLQQDIALAKQTFEARVVPEVRERFDYLYDEILRQLAEGDVSKLGPEAPAPKPMEPRPSDTTTTATITAPPPDDGAARGGGAVIDPEAPTRTVGRTLGAIEAEAAKADAPVAEAPKPAPIEAPAAKPAEVAKPTGLAARGLPPPNPETAELEKNDPRHAAARRLARLSVSEIKLYHEDEVKAGREAKDLWKRMITDINLATQTYEKRVDKEVRERFDYLYDEIVRQLAEGDVSKLGPDAPKPKKSGDAEPAPPAAAAPAPAPAPAPKAEARPEPAPAAAPAPAPAAAPVAPAAASVAARYAPPTNPATAELEKNDPRHAAARRLARLSVSEIKLYHEDEVKAGREAKDLWKRLTSDIGLATQTYEKRVDKEVRERFDYLYDEILRQLAEGDVSKLGPDAPKPKADA